MDNQRKSVVCMPLPEPAPPQPNPAQKLHKLQFPEDLKWCKKNSSTELSSGSRPAELSSSLFSPQKQRSPVPLFAATQQSAILKCMLEQNPLVASGPSAFGSSPQHHSSSIVSDKELTAVDVLSSRFKPDRSKGENEDCESVKNGGVLIALPSPDEMIEQFKTGLTLSYKQEREMKKVKKVNNRKKSESIEVGDCVPTVDENTDLEKDGLEVACTRRDHPLAKEAAEKLSKTDKELPRRLSSKYCQGNDEVIQVMTGEFHWFLRPGKPQSRKVPKPCGAAGSSSKLGGKSFSQGRNKTPETFRNDNSAMKKKVSKEKKRRRGEKKREEGRVTICRSCQISRSLSPLRRL